jgi:nitrogen fixation/metabolism regulation signal transduction histidine kinase
MKFKQEGATYLRVVWLGVIVAQDVGSPMDPLEQHVLAVEKGALDSHLEGPSCDSASLY